MDPKIPTIHSSPLVLSKCCDSSFMKVNIVWVLYSSVSKLFASIVDRVIDFFFSHFIDQIISYQFKCNRCVVFCHILFILNFNKWNPCSVWSCISALNAVSVNCTDSFMLWIHPCVVIKEEWDVGTRANIHLCTCMNTGQVSGLLTWCFLMRSLVFLLKDEAPHEKTSQSPPADQTYLLLLCL